MIPAGLPDNLSAIAEEIDRIHESALWSAQGQFEQMKLWRSMNMVLGIPAATLAAVSGGTGLATGGQEFTVGVFELAPPVLALIAAAFGAALTTLNPSRRVSAAQASANAYLELQTAARQLLTVDLKGLDWNKARKRLDQMTVKRDEINQIADPPSRYARWRAKKNIEEGGQHYEVDATDGQDNR